VIPRGTVKAALMCAPSKAHGQAPVVQQACPLFVPMAEEGLIDGRSPKRWRTSISIP